MGRFFTQKKRHLAAFGLAFGFLTLLTRLHGQYSLDYEYASLILRAMGSKEFVAKEIYRFNMPFHFQMTFTVDPWIYNGTVILVNVILAFYLNINKDGIGLLVGILIFFVLADKVMFYIFSNLKNKECNFLLENTYNIRQFLEILPILPFLIDYFSRHPNLKPSKP